MTLQELIAELMKLGPKADEFADALKEGAGTMYQTIFNRGHKYANEENKTKISTLEQERDRERDRAAKAEAKAAKLEQDQPDVNAIRTEYKDKITELETALETAKADGDKRVQGVLDAQSRSELKALLMSSEFGSIDGEYASVMAERYGGRLKHEPVKDKPGEFTLMVMADGSENIPIQSKEPLKALAKELSDKVDARYKNAKVDNGSGTGGSGGGSGGQGDFDAIRKEVKDREKEKAEQRAGGLEERMGYAQRT